MKRKIWIILNQNNFLLVFLSKVYNILMFNFKKIKRNNYIINRGAFLRKNKIIIRGENNKIILNKGVRLNQCFVTMTGNNCTLIVNDETYIENLVISFEDEYCEIVIGKKCILNGGNMAVAENKSAINIGDNCLFSRNIDIVTTDSHSILDKYTGQRLNYAKNVFVGNNVWIGADVSLLKGAYVADNCVVGRKALVTKEYREENCIIAGIPAKLIKRDIEWKPERI